MRSLTLAALVGLFLAVPCGAPSVAGVAPPGGRIAFIQTGIVSRDNGEIFVVNASGRGARNLTRNRVSDDGGHEWSPEGRRIAFVSERPAGRNVTWWENIYVMNADGSGQRRLTHTYSNGEAVWAPDGRRIAFIRSFLDPPKNLTGDVTAEIYVMNADGSNARRLTRNTLEEHDLSWSKRGRLAFSRRPRLEPEANTGSEIWTMKPNGKGLLRLTENDVPDVRPVWSPDGQKLAFLRCRATDDDFCSIWVMNSDGSAQRQLSQPSDDIYSAVWSPDGQKVAFAAGLHDLYVADEDGRRVRKVTAGGKDRVLAPTWSPDGRKIAFHQYPCIYVVNADGSSKRRLLPRPGRPNFRPASAGALAGRRQPEAHGFEPSRY